MERYVLIAWGWNATHDDANVQNNVPDTFFEKFTAIIVFIIRKNGVDST